MNTIQFEDYNFIANLDYINWEHFRNTSFLITGSTGLIGYNLVHALSYISKIKNLNIQLILPVRNKTKAEDQFADIDVNIIHYDLGETLDLETNVDYIIHLAGPTSSLYFSESPVDTIITTVSGYHALLDWAVKHPVKAFVGVSTMEIYGFPNKGYLVKETDIGSFETMNSRNSYPIAKIVSENLCYSYYKQYRVPTIVLRATQTFGPGVKYDDNRVFAEFMRCVIEKKDIVLKSEGLTERCYLYTADFISAILVCLLNAEPGQAYTVANPDTYCSIKDMAKMVAEEIANGEIKVVYDINGVNEKHGYANTLYMNLDVEKMKKLGWQPQIGLFDAFKRMILSELDKDSNLI